MINPLNTKTYRSTFYLTFIDISDKLYKELN